MEYTNGVTRMKYSGQGWSTRIEFKNGVYGWIRGMKYRAIYRLMKDIPTNKCVCKIIYVTEV